MPFANDFTVNPDAPAIGTNFHTIQAAIIAATPNTRITVSPGTYAENLTISTNGLTLVSSGGRGETMITGSQGGSTLGTIVVSPNVNNLTIGGVDSGFTINGIDGPNAGTGAAAVYLRGAHNGLTISGNDIVANGDAGLRGDGSTIRNVTVDGNIFSGQTFIGAADTPRQLVTLGSNGGNSSNVTFTNNDVTGTAGGINTANQLNGSTLVGIDAQNSTISGNDFTGYTTGSAPQLLVREEDTNVTDNTFINTEGGTIGLTTQFALFEGPGATSGNLYTYGAGDDLVSATNGDDIFDGGAGSDTWVVSNAFFDGVNVVDLETGFAVSEVTGYDEVVNFENVTGSNQRDVLLGDGGNNTFVASGDSDVINGRGGSDTFDASNTNRSVTADLDDGDVTGAFTASLKNVENIQTGRGADTIRTSDADNTVSTGQGADRVYASGGEDDYDLGAGRDQVIFGEDRGAYTITWDGTDAVVTHTETGDTTTVSNAGILQFANTKVILVDDASAEFSSIQAAVNAASDGDEIIVADGTYTEQVIVDGFADLTITASEGAILKAPADVVETVRSSTGRELNAVLTVIDSTNVVIDGLTVNGDGRAATVDENDGAGQANFVGVVFHNASGGLEDVTITGVRDAYPGGMTADGFPVVSGMQRGVGLQVDNDTLRDFFMHGGEIKDFQKNGTVFSGADLDVSGVTITGGGAQPIIAQNGLQVTNSTGSIDGNTITDIGYAGAQDVYSGIILAFGNSDLNITDNTLTGANEFNTDAKVVGVYVFDNGTPNSGGSITGNVISFVDEGIDVSGGLTPNSILIEDNTVTDVDPQDQYATGVYFAPDASLDVAHDVDGSDAGDDLSGGAGDDVLAGLGGDDVINGKGGSDDLSGGADNDRFVYDSVDDFGPGESVDGGEGLDTIEFASAAGGTLTLTAGVTNVETVQISENGSLDLAAMNVDASAVETALTINGNAAANDVTGTTQADRVNGNGGDDTFTSLGGNDTVDGGSGTDTAIVDGTATFAVVDGDWQVTGDTSGTDTVLNVEIVQDGTGARFLLVGESGFATIQDALDAAQDGDTILLAPGAYEGNFTISVDNLTIRGLGQGLGDVTILGTFEDDNGITGDVNDFLETAPGYSAASGTAITVAAAGVTIENVTIDSFATGIAIADGANDLTISNVNITDGVYGIRKGAAASADDVTIDGSSLEDLYIGVLFEKAVGAAGRVDGLTITDTSFVNLGEKGIYLETGSNVLISDITMNDVGQFGRGPAFGTAAQVGEFGNGIDINLKYDNGTPYENIVIEDFDFTDVGASAGVDAVSADFGGAIVIKARDDAGSYNVNTATYDGEVTVRNGTIDGTSTGIRAGEAGKNISTPAVTVENVAIIDATIAEADNVTQSTMTITLTDADDDFALAPTTTGNVVINGAGGDDTLQTGSGADELIGGAGDDVLIGAGGEDILNGGAGIDTASYVGSAAGVSVNLTLSTATGGDGEGDTLANIENLTGSAHNDTLTGDEEANVLSGGAGNDRLTGADGDDSITHADGHDTIDGGNGTDTVVFAGDWGDYTITRVGSTYTVTGFGFTDTVTDVETFVFDGLSVDVTEDPDVIVTAIGPEAVSVQEAGIDEDEDADTLEVDEGSQTGTVVATVTADDTNLPAGDTLTFTLVDADGDAYTGPFTITKTGDGTAEITVDGTLDFLTQSNHVLIVKITDSDGQSTTQDVTVTVLDVNDAPSDIEFGDDAPSVDENVAGAVITTVLGFDQNAGDVLSYTVDDIRFTITEQDGTYVLRLKEGETLDHETADTVTVSITATDLEGATRSEDLTITVNDVNEVPTNILFDEDAPQIDENEMGAVITTLTASDPDDGDTLSFSVSDERFEVVEDDGTYTLKLKDDESLNFEAENGEVTLTVSVMDSQGETRDEDITITLNDLNEGPTDIVLDEGTPGVSENEDGAVITTLIVADQDANDSFNFSVDDDRFEIVEEDGTFSLKLKAGETLDYEVETAVDLEITVEDADGESFTKTLTVTVLDVNEAPGNGAALAVWTPDAAQSGLRRAELFPEAGVTDPEGDDLTYTLVTGPTAGTLYLRDVAVVAGQELSATEFATLTYGAPAAGSYGAAFTVSDGANVTPLNIVLTVSAAVDDTLVASSKGGTLDGGAGDDTIRGSSSDDTLYGGAGADSIRGGDSGDSLFGADGADILRGNKGDDTLFGESGKDFVAGGLGDDLIYGGLGNDKLHGRDGADTLDGGTGRDILRGGDGADDFVFSTALGRSNVDTIVDFASGVDEIVLDGAIFGALGGSIAAREFQIGAQADDRTDHLIYNKATGELFYDVDGSGRRDQILFAEFEAGTDLRFDDFAMLR